MKKEYFVYLLKCADGTLYCGYTDNIEKRVETHNSSERGAKYTRNRRPVSLFYFEKFDNKSDALKREHTIKKLSRIEKLKLKV
jgi:putative endonuclease